MPQVDTTTFFNQFSWFFLAFFIIYTMVNCFVVPHLNFVFRLRDGFMAVSRIHANTFDSGSLNISLKSIQCSPSGLVFEESRIVANFLNTRYIRLCVELN